MAVIPNTDVIVTGDVTAFTNLTSLVRATGFQSVFPETFGFLNDSPYSPLRRSGYLDYFPGDVPPNYICKTGSALNENCEFRTVGHWLVRRVPKHLFLLNLVLICRWSRYFGFWVIGSRKNLSK
ncbi:hypothetical protein AB0758_46280 [Tolypothrix bouteillei VB521301_2]|uniref:hypothetical protein n=1 Tax=Tolypothrix bouteillei TaxID=1246981 RepID=UPI0038B649A4